MDYLIGVDIGTTGTKTALFDLHGNEVAVSYVESKLSYPKEGWVEQDPWDFYQTAIETISDVVEQSRVEPSSIKSICVAGQMAGILGVNQTFQPVTRYDSWLDTRCKQYIEQIRQTAELDVLELSGLPTMVAHCAKMLWWQNEDPQTHAQVDKYVMPTTFVVGQLTGLDACDAYIDDTHAHFSGLFDFYRGEWSSYLCDKLAVDTSKLPTKIRKPWDVIGTITDNVAQLTGLSPSTRVVAGCGDQAAGFLGAGIVEKGEIIDVSGTAAVFATCVDRYSPDVERRTLLTCKAATDDLWFPHAFISGGGLCLRWMKENIVGSNDPNFFHSMNEQAMALMDGPESSLFLPYLNGRNFPFNADMRGFWVGFNWKDDAARLYKAIMESIGYEYLKYLKIEQKLFPDIKFKRVTAIGGGAKSALFNQIKADILGIPYVTIDREEVGCLGAALIGGFGVGVIKELKQTVKSMNSIKQTFTPDMARHKAYQEFALMHEKVTNQMEGIYSEFTALQARSGQ